MVPTLEYFLLESESRTKFVLNRGLFFPINGLPQSPGEKLCCICCTCMSSHPNGSVGDFCSFPSDGNPFRRTRIWKACTPYEFSCECWGLNSGWRLSHRFRTYGVSRQCGWFCDGIGLRLDGILYHKPYTKKLWFLKKSIKIKPCEDWFSAHL